mmetsp:Transcript_15873/g.49131  ORF Transcript_15873/g.49131 Transcript_15873/m.49131 type:complete len:235 (+) Transcript_15873:295-999(+)
MLFPADSASTQMNEIWNRCWCARRTAAAPSTTSSPQSESGSVCATKHAVPRSWSKWSKCSRVKCGRHVAARSAPASNKPPGAASFGFSIASLGPQSTREMYARLPSKRPFSCAISSRGRFRWRGFFAAASLARSLRLPPSRHADAGASGTSQKRRGFFLGRPSVLGCFGLGRAASRAAAASSAAASGAMRKMCAVPATSIRASDPPHAAASVGPRRPRWPSLLGHLMALRCGSA